MRWPTFSPASNGSVHIFVTASRAELAWIVHIPGSDTIVGDTEAAEAQIESVTSEAAGQVAAASARASRAEQAQRRAEADRAEADAAAAEATTEAERLLQANRRCAHRLGVDGLHGGGSALVGERPAAASRTWAG